MNVIWCFAYIKYLEKCIWYFTIFREVLMSLREVLIGWKNFVTNGMPCFRLVVEANRWALADLNVFLSYADSCYQALRHWWRTASKRSCFNCDCTGWIVRFSCPTTFLRYNGTPYLLHSPASRHWWVYHFSFPTAYISAASMHRCVYM